MNRVTLLGALVAASFMAVPAAAATTVGSAAVSLVGVEADTASIGIGTTFSNTGTAIVGSGMGDFGVLVGQLLDVSSLTATVGEMFSFTSVWGDFMGTVQSASQAGSSDDRTVRAFVLGVFTPAGALSGFDAGPASATFAFSQTGSGAAVSGSFTFASPPAADVVPEPATWAMLIAGFGLVGFAARRRHALAA